MKDFEREYLDRALRSTNGRKGEAAHLLGISRKNLWEKLKAFHGAAHGVERDDEPIHKNA